MWKEVWVSWGLNGVVGRAHDFEPKGVRVRVQGKGKVWVVVFSSIFHRHMLQKLSSYLGQEENKKKNRYENGLFRLGGKTWKICIIK